MDPNILILKYIKSLNEKEKRALAIAQHHLETSFDIEKSNGFIEFKKKEMAIASK